jgi:UDP-N-acetylmuramate dehydrogenase
MKPLPDAPLDTLNTLRLPARAQWLADAETEAELAALLADPGFREQPRTVLGEGSNLVLAGDLPGLVLRPALRGVRLLDEDNDHVRIEVAAGEPWDTLVQYSLDQGWQGLENLSLIPGWTGAAPYQNIGAYGVELADRLASVRALRMDDGRVVEFSRADCGFGYRDSVFKSGYPGKYLITAVRLVLNKTPSLVLHYGALQELGDLPPTLDSARRVRDTVCAVRRARLPDPAELPNAGSFFKNPVISADEHARLQQEWPDLVSFPVAGGYKVAAGWLLDTAGWKGARWRDLGMHAHQALVMVNHGRATGADVLAFAERIRADIRARFGVELEREPVVLPRP